MINAVTRTQFIRFATVGAVSNLAIFGIYVAVTQAGVGHKTAMTLLYTGGVLATFTLNRNWSFRDEGKISASFLRYLAIYMVGYCLNFAGLFIAVDCLAWPHQPVQFGMIFVVATTVFTLQKFWVFQAAHQRRVPA
jgi:putative flippase GtrA